MAWATYQSKPTVGYVFRSDRILELNYQSSPHRVVGVCQEKSELTTPKGQSAFSDFIVDRCGGASRAIQLRSSSYGSAWSSLLRAYDLTRKSNTVADRLEKPLREAANSTRPKREVTIVSSDHEAWKAGYISTQLIGAILPPVSWIFDTIQGARQHDLNAMYEKAITEIQTMVTKLSVSTSELALGQQEIGQQLTDVRRVIRDLFEVIKENRIETQVMIMIQAADEASRSLDAAARIALNQFEVMLSQLFLGNTPPSMYTFRELEAAQTKIVLNKQERLYTAPESMISGIMHDSNSTTLRVATRVLVTGEPASLYETIGIPHLTEAGQMVRPKLDHRFVLVSSDMYMPVEAHEVSNCIFRACEFKGK